MAQSANDQLGRETERRYRKKILKNAKLLNDGCRGSKYTLCSERNTTCENIFATKSKQIYARKMICGDEFATIS